MLNENKIILVDIDEVMWYLLDPWVRELDSRFNLTIKPEDCMAWDLRLLFPMLTYEQILEPLHEADFWKSIKPRPDAQEYIVKLQEEDYIVRIVSATSFSTAAVKIPILLKHFPTIKEKDIILCEAKELVRGDFLIDDNIRNLIHRKYPILMESYHNRCEFIPDYMIKVDNWEDIYKYIKSKTIVKLKK